MLCFCYGILLEMLIFVIDDVFYTNKVNCFLILCKFRVPKN